MKNPLSVLLPSSHGFMLFTGIPHIQPLLLFILSLVEKIKITVVLVKQGPFRDVPALTIQPQKSNEKTKGGGNYTSIALLIWLCSCVSVFFP